MEGPEVAASSLESAEPLHGCGEGSFELDRERSQNSKSTQSQKQQHQEHGTRISLKQQGSIVVLLAMLTHTMYFDSVCIASLFVAPFVVSSIRSAGLRAEKHRPTLLSLPLLLSLQNGSQIRYQEARRFQDPPRIRLHRQRSCACNRLPVQSNLDACMRLNLDVLNGLMEGDDVDGMVRAGSQQLSGTGGQSRQNPRLKELPGGLLLSKQTPGLGLVTTDLGNRGTLSAHPSLSLSLARFAFPFSVFFFFLFLCCPRGARVCLITFCVAPSPAAVRRGVCGEAARETNGVGRKEERVRKVLHAFTHSLDFKLVLTD